MLKQAYYITGPTIFRFGVQNFVYQAPICKYLTFPQTDAMTFWSQKRYALYTDETCKPGVEVPVAHGALPYPEN